MCVLDGANAPGGSCPIAEADLKCFYLTAAILKRAQKKSQLREGNIILSQKDYKSFFVVLIFKVV